MRVTDINPSSSHIIILVPYELLTSPPSWLTSAFTLSPGGRHADNRTENRLILLADGSYIELIAFINDDPALREGHWWDKPYGIVDWALTSTDEEEPDVKAINSRLKEKDSPARYAEPVAGGRTRPDGVDLKWKVTFPTGVERGVVPFWCHDVTEREKEGTDLTRSHQARLRCFGSGRFQAIVGNDECVLGAPNAVQRLKEPWVRVQAAEAEEEGSGSVLKLALVLQTAGGGGSNAPHDIRQRVGDGQVDILFEES
ncbi:hypothetical protein Q7P36_005538 [Cladosporium allicinum]